MKKHLLPVLILIFISILFQVLRVNGKLPYVFLESDAGNIASFCAAEEYHEDFITDDVFNDPSNFIFYQTIHIYILPLLKDLFGDYGTAFFSLFGITLLIQSLGFYLLGYFLFDKRIPSFLFSFALTFITYWFFIDIWGFYVDPIPRISFQAVFPYIIYFLLKYNKKISTWYIAIFSISILVYVHSISALAWIVAFILIFTFTYPIPLKQKLIHILSLGVVSFLIILPFIYNYLHNTNFGSGANTQLINEIWKFRMRGSNNIPMVIFNMFQNLFVLLLIFLTAINFIKYKSLRLRNKNLEFFMYSFIAIAIISIVFPLIDYLHSMVFDRLLIQVDLVRTSRFFTFLLICINFIFIHELFIIDSAKLKYFFKFYYSLLTLYFILFLFDLALPNDFQFVLFSSFRRSYIGTSFLIFSIIIFISFLLLKYQKRLIEKQINIFLILFFLVLVLFNDNSFDSLNIYSSKIVDFIKPDSNSTYRYLKKIEKDKIDFLLFLRDFNNDGKRFCSISGIDDLSIRYFALKPMAFSFKDGGILGYANHKKLIDWYNKAVKLDYFVKRSSNYRIDGFKELNHLIRTDYVIFNIENIDMGNVKDNDIVYKNTTYVLIKI